MVRRSSRLRERATDINNEKSTFGDSAIKDKEETDHLEALVHIAYSVIKEKIAKKTDKVEEEINNEAANTEEEHISISLKNKSKMPEYHSLASELDPGLPRDDLYFKINKTNIEAVNSVDFNKQKFNDNELMKRSVITPDFEKKDTAPVHKSHYALKKQKKLEREKTAGSGWFNMAAPEMTPELKRDLTILKMRNVLDPKRHYKKNNSGKLPKYFQIGTVVSGAADFYSSRIPKSKQKNTIVEGLLADAEFRRYNKRKFLEIQASKQAAGKKGFYKRSRRKRR